MSSRSTKLLLRLTSPILAVALLCGMIAEHRRYLTEGDFEPYHARAKTALQAVPTSIGSWIGNDVPVVKAANQLLRPNWILSRVYKDYSQIENIDRTVNLLIVQCKRSGDMVGHYPRNCYRSIGNEMISAVARDWQIGGMTVPITEYHFRRFENRQAHETFVYNFMIVPGRGIVRDMEGVKAAAEDYQQRYYGAAQFQLVFHAALTQQERDEIFNLFLRPLVPTIKTLLDSGAPQ
jgi:hypothetical protein